MPRNETTFATRPTTTTNRPKIVAPLPLTPARPTRALILRITGSRQIRNVSSVVGYNSAPRCQLGKQRAARRLRGGVCCSPATRATLRMDFSSCRPVSLHSVPPYLTHSASAFHHHTILTSAVIHRMGEQHQFPALQNRRRRSGLRPHHRSRKQRQHAAHDGRHQSSEPAHTAQSVCGVGGAQRGGLFLLALDLGTQGDICNGNDGWD